jgi:acetyl esterase/lipase
MTEGFAARVDPQLRAALAGLPEILNPAANPDRARAQLREKLRVRQARPLLDVRRADVVLPAGIPVRTYEPRDRSGALPGLVWIHGGGFVMGNIDQNDELCDAIASRMKTVVLSVEYRLAPEHPFPAGPEDCYAALRWMHSVRDVLGVDAARVGIAGISGGGGLAASVALMARDRGQVPLAFQMLLCAMLDDRHITRSSREITEPRVWNRDVSLGAWRAYLGDHVDDPPPYASPARASDVSGLPPTYIAVGQLDVYCDENVEYAQRLLAADVPTELHVYPRAFHGFEVLAPSANISREALSERDRALMNALHPNPPTKARSE